MPPPEEFKTRINAFKEVCQDIANTYHTANKFHDFMKETIDFSFGSRFVIFTAKTASGGKRVHAFVDMLGGDHKGVNNLIGDILKPASAKSPAKHARGNIFADDFGRSCMSAFGPEYLNHHKH